MIYVPVIAAYLLGSIPFGLLVGFAAGVDIREHGSGNIGATNVLRVCGKAYGIPALTLDIFKGVVPVLWIAPACGADNLILVITGIAAVLGHNFPLWLKFRGGKGVATSAGVMASLMLPPFGVALATFLLVVLITRYISLGSMLASVALVVAQLLMVEAPFSDEQLPLSVVAILACLMVIARHRANISRLLAGEENRLGRKTETGDTDGKS